MGFRFRKSIKAGPLRINLSKSGIGYSIGGKGFRYTQKANGGTRKTYSIPGTGISYVEETGAKKKTSKKEATSPMPKTTKASSGFTAGSTSGSTSEKIVYCMNCYKIVEDGTVTCPHCGKPAAKRQDDPAKKPKKPFYKKWWFWAIVLFGMFNSCGSAEEPAPSDPVSVVATETQSVLTVPTTEIVLEPTAATTEETTAATEPVTTTEALQETAPQDIESLLKARLDGVFDEYTISTDGKKITIDALNYGTTNVARQAVSGEEKGLKKWEDITETVTQTCAAALEDLKSTGVSNGSVCIYLLNDQNTQNVLLTVLNGVVQYDYLVDHEKQAAAAATAPAQSYSPSYSSSGSSSSQTTYVLNTNTMKFHYASCGSASKIKSSNRGSFTGTRAEVMARGYSPCGNCSP